MPIFSIYLIFQYSLLDFSFQIYVTIESAEELYPKGEMMQSTPPSVHNKS